MGNCLKTQLKEVVNNDNLHKIGMLRVQATKQMVDQLLYYNLGAECSDLLNQGETMRFVANTVDANTIFGDDATGYRGTTIDSGNVAALFRIQGDFDSKFDINVYESSYIKGIFNLDDIPWSNTLICIKGMGGTTLDHKFSQPTGSINKLSKQAPNLRGFYCDYSQISGDLTTAFGSIISLRGVEVLGSNMVTGSIESLANAQIANGRTDGTLAIKCNDVITYNGSIVGADVVKTITFADGSYTIS